ncbi:MAG: phosphatidate cytidylyltransferase [Massilia sp.]
MVPHIVLPSALLYLTLAIASLAVSVGTRARPVSQLRSAVNSWWMIFPAVSVSLLLFPLGPVLLMLVIGAFGVRELRPYCGSRFGRFFLAGLAGLTALACYFPTAALIVPACLLLAQGAHFLVRKTPGQLSLLLFLFMGFGISFIVQFMHLPMPPAQQLAWLFYLFVLTALNDIAQFVAGKTLGRHKIVERISPNKTWQGLAGGLLVCGAVSLALGTHLALASAPRLLFIALLLSIGGFIGDILFSAAKRFLRIKDFSQLIPGHGGMLDRIDSLVVTAPLLYFTIQLTT